ncbi:N-acetyl-gamma-glutamyl-phosphate reductase [uncultured Sphingomonas sp.]|uniref:N-acetyl-gamma-glutamyl-phosphate reductase n=1 Tax=uncultured Sphingomonas sp. TaxID=158754 RepID=UPI0035CA4AD1
MTTVFIDGAAGTTGLEIRERLAGRSELTIIMLDEARRKDVDARAEALNDADFVILCLPDEAAREAVGLVRNDRTRIIDASSAHRVADGWTYGFPELGFDVAGASRVSNPGCYPTGFLALVAPMVRAGLIPSDWPYTVNAVSGYSGGGKALIERFENAPDLAFRAYGFALAHKHVPEMQRYAGLSHPPVFAPSVARAHRGMIVEIPLALSAMPGAPTRDALLSELATTFETRPLVRVHHEQPDELLLDRHGAPCDALQLYVLADPASRQARLVATLDNLGKGAAGAAIQSLNLMAGLDPLAGLIV